MGVAAHRCIQLILPGCIRILPTVPNRGWLLVKAPTWGHFVHCNDLCSPCCRGLLGGDSVLDTISMSVLNG